MQLCVLFVIWKEGTLGSWQYLLVPLKDVVGIDSDIILDARRELKQKVVFAYSDCLIRLG